MSADPALPAGPSLACTLPPGAAGRWCRVTVRGGDHAQWWAQLALTDAARDQIVRSQFLAPCRGSRATLVHVPQAAGTATLRLFGAPPGGMSVHITVLRRAEAALRLLLGGWRLIPLALRGDARGRLTRLRSLLGQAPARAGEAPPYALWIATVEASLPPPPAAPAPALQIAIVGACDAACSATRASLGEMPEGAVVRIATQEAWRHITAPWVALLAAGDRLAPAAMPWLHHAIAAWPDAGTIIADCDRFTGSGRTAPLLKPQSGLSPVVAPWMLHGVCVFPAAALRRAAGDLPVDAAAARLRLQAAPIVHIPRILTHCAEAPPASAPARSVPVLPQAAVPRVTAIIPSALRAPHVARCLHALAIGTEYAALQLHVAVSDMARAAPRILRSVAALPRVSIAAYDEHPFNYPRVNNRAARAVAASDLILLLNDDVAPAAPDFLTRMVAEMRDPAVGIVGARLLYGNGLIQHAGVTMGLAHLCEHAGRLQPGDAGGISALTRDVSAVTAACLLIRAELYAALGGMDENFAIALNDVDLCLRARARGARIVYCAQATLWHFESLSLGRHYAGERAALESREVRRLRQLWAPVIADDPYYNPLASVEPGREWQPGFMVHHAGGVFPPAESAIPGW